MGRGGQGREDRGRRVVMVCCTARNSGAGRVVRGWEGSGGEFMVVGSVGVVLVRRERVKPPKVHSGRVLRTESSDASFTLKCIASP